MHLDQALTRLRHYVEDNDLFSPADKLLIAVSGGKDSMCLLRLVRELPNEIGVAHVNYMLRGADSDMDAAFVRAYCNEHEIAYFEHQLDLNALIKAEKVSIQQGARRARYRWFFTLGKGRGYDVILTAHHQDDSLESFFINLLRGTGIRGLTGIPVKRQAAQKPPVVRPMMCFSRTDVDALAHEIQIPFREDVSNETDDYLRNRVRHHLIPLLEELKPGSPQRILKNMARLKDEDALLRATVQGHLQTLTSAQGEQRRIDLTGLRSITGGIVVLHAAACAYGFSREQCADLLEGEHQPGTRYLSDTHEMLIDREEIIITPRRDREDTIFHLYVGDTIKLPGGVLSVEETAVPDNLDTPEYVEYIDPAKSGTVFQVRRWHEGDRFQPLGMKGTQKVQDFFSNIKLSLADKRDTWLVTAQGQIVWIVGHRLDDRFKVDENTVPVLKLTWWEEG